MNPRMTALAANRYDEIVGVKIAHYSGPGWEPYHRAIAAGKQADIPVMVDFGGGRKSIEELFMELLRPGDIFTHVYHRGPHKEPIVDENGTVKPFVFAAEEKGIIFDVGHGGGSFYFAHAIPAIEQGLLPNTISTDVHIGSMNDGMKNQVNVMSKFLNLGLSIQDVVLRSTWNPALAIKRPELGHLSVGAEADIAVFNLHEGDFGFVDSYNFKMNGNQKLETELTIRAGDIVWDLNGLSAEPWEEAVVNPK
jgi:dihydroorotase